MKAQTASRPLLQSLTARAFLWVLLFLASPAAGQTGAALNFDGNNDFVNIPHPVSGDFSVEYWMRTSVAGPTGTQWYMGNGIVDAEFPGEVNDWGTSIVGTKLAFGIGNPQATIFSTSNVNTGAWVHVAATWKQSTGEMKLYINGALESSGTGSTNARNAPTRITIGELQTNINRFNGSVDEVRIWNRVLSSLDIQFHQNCEIATSGFSLAANYHFNQGTAAGTNTSVTTLTDASGNSRTGTLNNFALTGATSNWVTPGGITSGSSCSAAQMMVLGNNTDIPDGQTVPSASNFTDFGNCDVSTFMLKSYTIYNNSSAALNINNITLTGTNAAQFAAIGAPATIAAAGTGTITILFVPISAGAKTATVHIDNSSTDAADFDFAIQGTGTMPGAALSFDGSNDYVSIPYPVSSDFSVEFWMKTTSTGPSGVSWANGNGLVDANSAAVTNDWGTSLLGNKVAFGIGNPDLTLTSTSVVNTGNWVHVAATWKRTTGQMKLYINGVLEGTATGSTNLRSTLSKITIGSLQTVANFFNGTIDEVRIWNRVLTAGEIVAHGLCEVSGAASGLAANYHFNQGIGGVANTGTSTLTDASGNTRTGTMNNFALTGSTSNWVSAGAVTTGNTCTSTQINLQSNGIDIPDGQTSASSTNLTDFGTILNNGSVTRTFTIQNTGIYPLNITSITLVGSNAFTLGTAPTSIAAMGSATFTVTFSAASAFSYGATIHVNSDASNAGDYDFAVQGVTIAPVAASTLRFDGVNDFVSIPHPISGDFSVEYWTKTTSTGPATTQWYAGNGIVDAETGGEVNDWGTSLVGSKVAFGLGNPQTTIFSTTDINTGAWVHVAATWTQSTGQMKLYINGVQEAVNNSGPTGLRNAPPRITIGETQTDINRFAGSVDELRLWTRVLSQAEIMAHKDCEISGPALGLAASYHFNQGDTGVTNTAVTTLTDASGNNRTGTLNNFALSGSSSNWAGPGGVVSGTSCTGPQINIQSNSIDIADGQSSVSVASSTEFESNLTGTPRTSTFTIQNTGFSSLSITSITVTGAGASAFTIGSVPTTIAAAGTASFTVTFNASAAGDYTAVIHVNNNTPNGTDFDFTVHGTSVVQSAGGTLNFDGVNDFINIPHPVTGDFSVEYWMKTSAVGPSGTIWTHGNGIVDATVAGISNDWGTSIVGSKLAFGIGNPDATIFSTSSINTGSWVHVAATWKQSTGQMRLFINGVEEASRLNGAGALRNTPPRITIGQLQTNVNRFNGFVDELRVWNRVLSPGEILDHKDCEIATTGFGLAANYHFNQGDTGITNTTVTALADASGNNRTGTLNNFALTGNSSNWVSPGGVANGNSCLGAQIFIAGNNVDIADGQTVPSAANLTDFSTNAVGVPVTKTYTIQNLGVTPLTISGATFTGTGASSFSAGTVAATLAPGGTSSFTVTFNTATAGVYAATMHINSNAINAADYDFAVQGSSIVPIAASSLTLDGVNDFVSIPHVVSGDFSVEYWMKTSVAGPAVTTWPLGNGIVDAEVGGAANDWGTSIAGDKLAFGIGNPDVTVLSTSAVNTGNWVHVAATWKQSTGQMKLYINGVLEGSGTSATQPRSAPGRITIGEIQTDINRFKGSIDELRIWNRVLTQPEIAAHKDCEIPATGLSLAANYHFNQGSADVDNSAVTSLTDASGNGNTGALNNVDLTGSLSNWTAGGGVTTGTSCSGILMNITGNSTPLTDGQITVSSNDFTDFGLIGMSTPVTRTFTIQNVGSAALNISSIDKTGADTAQFSLGSIPATIPAGGSASFTVTFNSSTLGTFTATIHVVSNASNTADFDFVVKAATVPHGEALNFDGINDFISIPHPVSSDFSVEYWMKTSVSGPSGTTWPQGSGLVDAEVNGGNVNDWGTSLVGNKVAFGIGNPDITILSTSNVSTGNWVHVAATWKQSTGQMKLYINGALEASGTSSTGLRNVPPRITIGEIQTDINRFNGSLDEIRIWNRTLTQMEVQAHKDCEINTAATGLAANYHFNQGDTGITNSTVNTLTDASGNNRTGTLNNFALSGSKSNWVMPGGVSTGTSCYTTQILVQGNNITITDGQTAVSASDFTSFGTTLVNTPLVKTYTLFNTGLTPLNISSISMAGADAPAFTVSGAPSSIAIGGSATFTVSLASASAGNFNATVHVNSDAQNASDFDFAVNGIAILQVSGAALNFDGVNDFINIPHPVSSDFTVEYWMKTTVAGPAVTTWPLGNGIVDAEFVGAVNDWGTSIAGTKLAFGIGNPDVTVLSTSAVNTGNWVHVAATWKQATGQMKLYINGVLEGTGTSATNLRNAPTRITIGQIQSGINRFNGSVDEVRIWNKVLSQGEILEHKDCEITVTLPALAANYHFNQGDTGVANSTVNTLIDASGNNRTGTLNNFALVGSTSNWSGPGGLTTGTSCTGAYIQAQGNSNDITDGQSTTSIVNSTDMGNTVMSTPISKTYTIQNNGISALNITGIVTTGGNAAAFTVSGVPATIAAGSSASFTVSFSSASLGTYTSSIHIASDATNAADFDFAVQASVILPVAASTLHFDGSNDYVNIPNLVSSDFTVEYWMKATASGPSGTTWTQGNGIVDASVAGTVNDWGTSIVGNKLAFGVGNPDVTLLSTSVVNTGNWVHVAATWKQSTGQMKLYINGVQEAAATGSLNLRSAPTRITIGELQTDVNRFNGYLDEVRIWNRVLMPQEIMLHKDCEVSGTLSALAASYHFNQGDTGLANASVTTLTDASGNNKMGTLNNFALSGSTSNWAGPGVLTTGSACSGTQISIQANNTEIADGQSSTSPANFTDFGTNVLNVPLVRTFTIQNIGFTALNITGMQLTGADASKFALSGGTGSIAVGGTATFTVTYVSAVAGTYSATVHVNSDAGNAGDYDYAVSGTTAPAGAALQFDGSNDFINIPNVVSSDFTVEYWLKTSMTGFSGGQWYNGNGLVDAEVGGVVNDWGTALVGNKFAFGLGNPETTIFSSSAVNTGNWVHVAATWKQSTGQMKLYVNGIQEATTTGPTNLRSAPTRITLGEIQTNNNFFNGAMDEVRIWNRVLSQSEIQSHKDCETPAGATGLAANYHFNQGNAALSNSGINTLTDASGNNKTGTLNNFALSGTASNWIAPGGVASGTSCTGGQINVKGNAADVNDGQTIALAANFTDFGNNLPNNPLTRTFTIENIGYTTVNISSITVSGTGASTFAVAGAPTTIAAGATASFDLTFSAANPATYVATVHVNSDATNAADYDFAVQATAVPPGAALNFDGSNDFVNIPHGVSSDFSVEYWMKTSASGPSGTVWTQGNGIVDASVAGTVNDWGTSIIGNKLAFGIGNPDATLISTSSVNNGNWVHVAATWKQSTGQMKLYINGLQEATTTGSTNLRNAPTRITIGELQTDNNRFNGSVDELRVWNKVLSAAEIQEHRNCEVNGPVSQLLSSYHFNQGDANVPNSTVTTLIDASGNNNTGTLNNFALTGSTSNWTAPGGVASGVVCTGSQVSILGNNSAIADGQTTAASSNFTDFGSNGLNTLISKTFTISNFGFNTLNITGIGLTGADAAMFSSGSAPLTIAPGASDDFTVTFSSATVGVYNATVHLFSDATNAADYDFAIKATAVCTTIYPFYADNDGDGFGAGVSSLQCAANAATPPMGFALSNTDCNDNNASVWQSGTFYVDNDGDQYDNGSTTLCYGILPSGYSLTTLGTDCDDNNPAAWQTGTLYVDSDGDGYDNGTAITCYGNLPAGYSLTTLGTDCDDNNAAAWQTGTLYVDSDDDGYDNGTAVICYGNVPAGYSLTTLGTDCSDNNPAAWQTGTLYVDSDGDGYDNGTAIVCYGNLPEGYSLTSLGTDCDDNNAAAWQTGTLYVDSDGDQYDNGTAVVCYGNLPAGYNLTTLGPDCNDSVASIHVFCCPACVGTPSKINKPGNAGAITPSSTATICPGETRTYTVAAIPRACYYIWSVPAGCSIVSGDSTNSIMVQFTTGFIASGTVAVFGQNSCGAGSSKSLAIKRGTAPAITSSVTGTTTGLCKETASVYTVLSNSGQTYSWSLTPSSAGAISGGQGTNAAIVDFASNWTDATISVTATNGCGTGAAKNLKLKSAPGKPGPISGPVNLCPDSSAVYSIAPIYGAARYTWTGPKGASISDGATTATSTVNTFPTLITSSNTVTIKIRQKSGSVTVVPGNDCDDAESKTLKLTASCIASREEEATLEELSNEVVLAPNPVHDKLSIRFQSGIGGDYELDVLDALGKIVQRESHKAVEGKNEQSLDVNGWTPGVYLLVIRGEGINYTGRFVVQ